MEHEPVSVADAEIAAAIARGARTGRAADRRPTPEQIVAAFGEAQATPEARRRAEAALGLAGVTVVPPLADAPAGERVELVVAGRNRRGARAFVALGILVALVAGVAAAATLVGDDAIVGDVLSDDATVETTVPTPTGTTTVTGATGPTEPTGPTGAATTPTRTTTTRRRTRPAPARRTRAVTVRVDAKPAPTFLCVEDGEGRVLFNGTLTGRRVFRARRVRLNIGLASTIVKVGRRTIRLPGSPAGLEVTRSAVRPLPLGQRPCA